MTNLTNMSLLLWLTEYHDRVFLCRLFASCAVYCFAHINMGRNVDRQTHMHSCPAAVCVRCDDLVTAISWAVLADLYLDQRQHEKD